jgi:hypothetical protein
MPESQSITISSSAIPGLQTSFTMSVFGSYRNSLIELVPNYIESSSSSFSSSSSRSSESSSVSTSSTRMHSTSSSGSSNSSLSSESSSTMIGSMSISAIDPSFQVGPILENGKTYRIVCSGTYTIWWNAAWLDGECPGGAYDGFSHDSFWMYAMPASEPSCGQYPLPLRDNSVMLRLDGVTQAPLSTYYSGPYRTDHRYEIWVEGRGGQLEIKISDNYSPDNFGDLYMEIYT